LFRRTIAIILAGILLSTAFAFQCARAQSSNDDQLAVKARATVQRLGVGHNSRVEVKLRDNSKLKGYIGAADENSFTVTDSHTGASRTVAYTDVAQVKKQGGGLSPLTWGIIGGAAVAAIIVGVTVIKPVVCDGGAGC